MVKNLPAMQETQAPSLGWEGPLEESGYHRAVSQLVFAHLLFLYAFLSRKGGNHILCARDFSHPRAYMGVLLYDFTSRKI